MTYVAKLKKPTERISFNDETEQWEVHPLDSESCLFSGTLDECEEFSPNGWVVLGDPKNKVIR